MRRLALVPLLTLGFLLFPPAASALGLGEIEMQSALNERLDAEIPLRGVTEGESGNIIVTLASEEAFRQVGLQRPFALTRLQFEVKQHDNGQHYVHVTSREPIVEPFLTFLVEVDWPDGNLLREYTVLLDPPVFVTEAQKREPAPTAEPEAAEEMEAADAAGVPTEIEREPEPAAEAEPAPEPKPAAAPEPELVAEPTPPAGDFADTPVFLQVEQEEERAEAADRQTADAAAAEPTPEPEPEPGAATTRGYEAGPDDYGPVERGETLWDIATRLKRSDMTVQQMMLALLRYNPEAFIQGNINLLKQGYVLRIPEADEVLSLSAQQAVARVREQNSLWQEYVRTVQGGAAAPAVAEAESPGGTEVTGEDAGLRIVGSEEGTGAGSEEPASATTTGGEQTGEELRLVREQLESAEMEKAELQSRVDELEDTVGKMERLIQVREDQLARLQEQLRQLEQDVETEADTEAADDEPAETTGTEEETPAADDEPTEVTETAEDEQETAAAGTTGGGDGTGTAAAGGDGGQAADADITVAEADTGAAAQAAGGTAGGDQGATMADTRPRERGWLETAAGFWDSVKLTVSGMLVGIGLGSLLTHPFALPALGGAVVLLLLGLLLLSRRRRGGGEEEIEVGPGGEAVLAGGGSEEDNEFAALLQSESDDDVAVEEQEGDDTRTATGEDAESALMTEEFNLDDLDREEEDRTATAAASEDDTLAEADVYLAYGLHQQAEDLLKLALQEHPDRLDYHAKLLETLYGAGKTEAFVEGAEAFQAKVGDPNDSLWLRTVAMGKELAPDNPLFQQEVDESLKPAEPAAARAPGADFEVGGEGDDTTDLDFSLGDEPEEVDEKDDEQFGRTVMLGSEEFEGGSAERAEGDAGLVGPDESRTEAAGDEEMDFDLSDFSVDEPGETGTSEGEEGAAEEGEFEFDLGDLDMDEDEVSELPTDTGDEEEDTAAGETGPADVDLGELGEESLAETDTGGAEDEGFDIDLGDLEETGGEEPEPTGADESFDLGGLELESDEDETRATEESGGAESADEETITLDTGDDSSLEELAGELGGGESEPEPAADIDTDDEFDTMLDLARAYIDMGDAESARAALEEVAESGNDKQRSEAQSLLESV